MNPENSFKMPAIALAGRPNVGKSTLFNRLTRSRTALVDYTPGVTRDRRYAEIDINGLKTRIIDTGGLEDSHTRADISELVSRESLKAIQEADIVFLLMDASQGLTPADMDIADRLRNLEKPVFFVANKVDNRRQELEAAEFYELGVERVYFVSAAHGRGIDSLMQDASTELAKQGFTKQERLPQGAEANTADNCEQPDAQPETDEISVRVAIAGRPNVGKSSLLNSIIGQERMIVADMPGTTRDAIDTVLHRTKGYDLIFTDTAGIRRKARVRDKIEKFSIIKAIEAIKNSDIVLVVLDASEGVTDQDQKLIGYTDQYGKACITLFNKFDLIQKDKRLVKLRSEELKRAKRFISYAPHLNISALTGRRVDKILPVIDRLYNHFKFECSTGRANRILQKALSRRNPPISKGHHLKLYYTTQVAVKPPTFVIFANYPQMIPEQYRRFLTNFFRQELELEDIPIRILFRQRERRP